MYNILKTTVIYGLQSTCANFVVLPKGTSPHARGVHFFCLCPGIETLRGAMDSRKDGSKCRKRIVVRPSRFRPGLHELYTYHFPTHYSEACIANRNRIKAAQRLAHNLEHACTPEALTWKIRFFRHYFTVVKGNAAPEPGLKPYARFYHYVYVSILRYLESTAQQPALQSSASSQQPALQSSTSAQQPAIHQPIISREPNTSNHPGSPEEVTFEPIPYTRSVSRTLLHRLSCPQKEQLSLIVDNSYLASLERSASLYG